MLLLLGLCTLRDRMILHRAWYCGYEVIGTALAGSSGGFILEEEWSTRQTTRDPDLWETTLLRGEDMPDRSNERGYYCRRNIIGRYTAVASAVQSSPLHTLTHRLVIVPAAAAPGVDVKSISRVKRRIFDGCMLIPRTTRYIYTCMLYAASLSGTHHHFLQRLFPTLV